MIALQVGELRPYAKKVEVIVKVLDKNEAREVHSKLDNRNHSVTEALVGDSSGTILLTLWDDAIDKLVTGLEQGEGSAGALLRDKQLYENINSAATELKQLIGDIRKDPKKFLNVRVSIW